MAQLTALIVSHDDDFKRQAAQLLRGCGVPVGIVDGRSSADGSHPDIAVVDLRGDAASGMSAIERLRAAHASMAIFAIALAAEPDYIALGPIFPTTLKAMRFAPQGIPKITEWKKRVGNVPLVAIGGIKLEQAPEIYAAGADSIAVVSDVTQIPDPDGRVRAWLASLPS